MKFGLLTAILEGTTFEEAVDFAAENQLECLEVACWPNTGGAKRRYAGVCHIDAEALTEEKAKEIIQYCKERNVEISSLGYYPNTLDPDLEKRKQYIDHIYALIDASSMLNVNMVTTFLGRVPDKNVEENLEIVKEVWPPILEYAKEKGVKIAYVTLHVGLGTFRPVKEENVLEHHMHSEFYQVTPEAAKLINDTKAAGGRVICVGTTSCRTIESAADQN